MDAPSKKPSLPRIRIGSGNVVVTPAMLDAGMEVLDEHLHYSGGVLSRAELERAFQAMCQTAFAEFLREYSAP